MRKKAALLPFSVTLIVILFLLACYEGRASFEHGVNKAVVDRSLLSKGDTSRLRHAFSKAMRGEDLLFGVIGGSVTEGFNIDEKARWSNIVYQWWQNKFPQSKIRFINAGIGGSNSNYGAHRIERDLLKYNPDFIIVEFAVNDWNSRFFAETLEGLIRQALKSPSDPALMLLLMTYKDGHSAQKWHSKVGQHYRLPLISYGDAIKYAINTETMKWKDVSNDIVHPNSLGNQYCAQFIINFLDTVLSEFLEEKNLAEIDQVPGPLISDTFEFTSIFNNRELQFTKNSGWSEFEGGWKADSPGSEIEFELEGRAVSIMYKQKKEGMAAAIASVDDMPPVRLNGFVNAPWTRRQLDLISSSLDAGLHDLNIKVLNGGSGKEGNIFQIYEILVAGHASKGAKN